MTRYRVKPDASFYASPMQDGYLSVRVGNGREYAVHQDVIDAIAYPSKRAAWGLRDRVVEVIRIRGTATPRELADAMPETTHQSVRTTLRDLLKAGRVVRVSKGVYRAPTGEERETAA